MDPADQTSRSDLRGCRVLVIEDDYYIATDAQRILENSGATVVGPCGNVAACFALLAPGDPDCAIVDINLGYGPSFDIPAELKRRGIPFLFVTGYDARTIPDEYADVQRLQKPIETEQIVPLLAQMCSE